MLVDFKDITFDRYDSVEKPVLTLKTMDGTKICTLGNYQNLKCDFKFNDISEITFEVPKTQSDAETEHYDRISGMKLVEVEPFGDFILMNPEVQNDGIKETKSCIAYSLEYTLNFKKVHMAANTYNFYNPADMTDTIMQIILENAPGWKIGSVDNDLIGKYRTFEASNKNLYEFMINTLQDAYNCMFIFDCKNRTINVVNAEVTVENVPVYLSYDNLLKSCKIKELTEDVVTCLSVYGADPLSIASVNPLGNAKIYNLDYYVENGDINEKLAEKWQKWKEYYDKYYEIYKVISQSYTAALNLELAEKANLTTIEGQIFNYNENLKVYNTQLAAFDDTYKVITFYTESNLKAYTIAQLKALAEKMNYIISGDDKAALIKSFLSKQRTEKNYAYSLYIASKAKAEEMLTKKKAELTAQQAVVANAEKTTAAFQNERKQIVAACAISNFFTEEEYITLSAFFKEDTITEDSFVVTKYDSTNADRSGIIAKGSKAKVTITNSKITNSNITEEVIQKETDSFGVDMTETFDLDDKLIDSICEQINKSRYKDIYDLRSGNISLQYTTEEVTLSGDPENTVLVSTDHSVGGTVVKTTLERMVRPIETFDTMPPTLQLMKVDDFLLTAVLKDAKIDGTSYKQVNLTLQGHLDNFVDLTDSGQLGFNISEGNVYMTAQVCDYQTSSVAQQLYDFGLYSMNKLASPSFEFSVESSNFIFAKKFEPFKNALALGKTINLDLPSDYSVQPILIEVAIEYDKMSELTLKFSDKFRSNDSTFKLADIIGKASSSSDATNLNKFNYAEFKDSGVKSGVNSLINDSLDLSKKSIINSENQSLEINNSGMYLRKKNGYADSGYDDEQIGLVNNNIAFTNDGWSTVKLGIGKFSDPNTGESWGIVAPSIAGTLITGENLVIENKNADGIMQFKVDASGAYLNNASFLLQKSNGAKMLIDPEYGIAAGKAELFTTDNGKIKPSFIDANGNVIFETYSTTITGGGTPETKKIQIPKNTNFYIDPTTGKAYFKGDIYAENGYFANGYFSDDILLNGKSIIDGTIEGIKIVDNTITNSQISNTAGITGDKITVDGGGTLNDKTAQIDTGINNAQNAANGAQTAADNAQTAANNAGAIADAAKNTSATASTNAASALSKAAAAAQEAADASAAAALAGADADNAEALAAKAKADAENAATLAAAAKQAAEDAKTTVAGVQAVANAAQTTANEAKTSAATANSAADSATTIANEALAKAGQSSDVSAIIRKEGNGVSIGYTADGTTFLSNIAKVTADGTFEVLDKDGATSYASFGTVTRLGTLDGNNLLMNADGVVQTVAGKLATSWTKANGTNKASLNFYDMTGADSTTSNMVASMNGDGCSFYSGGKLNSSINGTGVSFYDPADGTTQLAAFTNSGATIGNITKVHASIDNDSLDIIDGTKSPAETVASFGTTGANITKGTISGANIVGGTMNVGNGMFSVNQSGYLSATNASINGNIYSNIGTIAGINLNYDGMDRAYSRYDSGTGSTISSSFKLGICDFSSTGDGLGAGMYLTYSDDGVNIQSTYINGEYIAISDNTSTDMTAINAVHVSTGDVECSNVESNHVYSDNVYDKTSRLSLVKLTNDGTVALSSSSRPSNSDTAIWAGRKIILKTKAYLSNGTTAVTSDKNVKKDISLLDDKYITLFDNLKPAKYKYRYGTAGRLHCGFIAQDVKEAMDKAGVSDMDFAGWCKYENDDEDYPAYNEDGTKPEYTYALCYEEFIPILAAKIKQLEKQIEELKTK